MIGRQIDSESIWILWSSDSPIRPPALLRSSRASSLHHQRANSRALRVPDRVPPGRWPSRLVEGDPPHPSAAGATPARAGSWSSPLPQCSHATLDRSTLPTTAEIFSLTVLVGKFPVGKYPVLRGPGRAHARLCCLRVGAAL